MSNRPIHCIRSAFLGSQDRATRAQRSFHQAARGLRSVALLLLCALNACDEPRRLSLNRKEEGFIAFVGNAKSDPIWRVLAASANRYRTGMGNFDLTITATDFSTPNAQIRLLRQLHDPRMRGLCIWPADTAVMEDILLDIRMKGVPVVTMMTRIPTEEPFLHSGVDEFAIGRAMADAAFDAVGGKGTIAVLMDGSDSRPHADRYLGFQERARQLPSMTILTELDCMDNAFVGQRMVREYSQRFPRLNAWVAIDDWPLRKLKPREIFMPGTCKMVTYRPHPDYWGLLNEGTCHALIGAEYDRIAENAIQMCTALARGDVLDRKGFFAKPTTVTRENLQQYRIQWFQWLDSK